MDRTKLIITLAAAIGVAGCQSDENSPEMGAVAPKPKPEIIQKMPEQLRDQMKNAESGMQRQVQQMESAAKAGR